MRTWAAPRGLHLDLLLTSEAEVITAPSFRKADSTTVSGSFDFVLGSVEASVVGQALGADVRRFPLRVRNTTIDADRLRKLAGLVSGKLAERRLLVGNDPHPKLKQAFDLLSHHRVSVAVSGLDGRGKDIAVLAMTDGAQALGITQNRGEDDMLFSLFSDDDFIDIVAGVLPRVGAAPGPTATVKQGIAEYRSAFDERRAAERAHDEDETSAFGNLKVVGMVDPPRKGGSGTTMTDERRLTQALSGERMGGGQIVVSGGESSSRRSISWVDTDEGRYLIHTSEVDNEFVARYEPAGQADVVRAIRDLVAETY